MDVQTTIRQLTWRSKRGLLELELLLEPFVRQLGELSRAELEQYGRLLEHDDLDLYDWLRGVDDQDQVREESLQAIVERIRESHSR